jgi:hypothetical protein
MNDPEEAERAVVALLAALTEAQDLAARGRIDAEFRDLLRYARELQDIIVDSLGSQETELRSAAARMGVKIAELEVLARNEDQGLH